MKRRAAKVDDNQAEIVAALRACGCSVAVTSSAGGGFPDLCVGIQGKNYLLEVKDGSKSPSRQKLTPDQVTFHATWEGQVNVVRNIDEALIAVRLRARPSTYARAGE